MTEKLAAEIVKKSGIMRDTGMTPATPKPRAGEHTKGPWGMANALDYFVIKSQNGMVARTLGAMPLDEANARRIVACVNICEGIETEELERGLEYGLMAAKWNELEEGRDLLREELERARAQALADRAFQAENIKLREREDQTLALAAGFMPESNHAMFVDAVKALAKHGR